MVRELGVQEKARMGDGSHPVGGESGHWRCQRREIVQALGGRRTERFRSKTNSRKENQKS